MLNFLRKKYDWFIYWASYRSLNRIFKESPGMAYLIELRLRRMREENPLPEDLARATEIFEDAIKGK